MQEAGAKRQKGSLPVALMNGGVGLAVLVLVAVLALVVNPPAPPGIAAFAPQANKPIIKAPQNQSASTGEGDGACAAGQACSVATTTTTSTTIKGKPRGVPSGLQCYSWPDGTVTQTFDPQSPPCIATWDDEKGNGGETSKGVTASEIRIAFPMETTGLSTWPKVQPIVDFFNTRFQLYGRKIRVVPFASKQANEQGATATFNVPEAQRADATQITQLGVFASLDFIDPLHYSFSLPVFRDILTRNKIISINGGEVTPYGTAEGMAKAAPYEWTYLPTIDSIMANAATVLCRQLVGRNATHAPDRALRGKARKFALVLPTDAKLGGPLPGLAAFQQTIAGCGVSSPKVVRYSLTESEIAPLSAQMRELSTDGVTTMIFFPYTGAARNDHPMTVASRVGFRPEWYVIGWNKYLTASLLNTPRNETEGAFGVGVWNKLLNNDLEMWARAFLAGGGDQGAINLGGLYNARAFYQEMLMFASGIQMAGPNLTPETFAQGLANTRFSNPGAARAPSYQATVGFGPGDVTMTDDYNQFWLDPNGMTGQEVGLSLNNNTSRAVCYVELGRRWGPTAWTTTDLFYANKGCR